MNKLRQELVSREVIDNQLLVALDDKSKVAVVLDADDLQTLITALKCSMPRWCDEGWRLLDGLQKLQKAAFG